MELILWRHADAEDGADDMARRLSAEGERQAAAMAAWLRGHLPGPYTLLASPAVRAQQTAAALSADIVTESSLAPGALPPVIIEAARRRKGLVIVVGHQPDLGRAAAKLPQPAHRQRAAHAGCGPRDLHADSRGRGDGASRRAQATAPVGSRPRASGGVRALRDRARLPGPAAPVRRLLRLQCRALPPVLTRSLSHPRWAACRNRQPT